MDSVIGLSSDGIVALEHANVGAGFRPLASDIEHRLPVGQGLKAAAAAGEDVAALLYKLVHAKGLAAKDHPARDAIAEVVVELHRDIEAIGAGQVLPAVGAATQWPALPSEIIARTHRTGLLSTA